MKNQKIAFHIFLVSREPSNTSTTRKKVRQPNSYMPDCLTFFYSLTFLLITQLFIFYIMEIALLIHGRLYALLLIVLRHLLPVKL